MENLELQQLKKLADPFQDFVVIGQEVLFYKSGESHEITVKKDPSLGIIVCKDNGVSIDQPFIDYVKTKLIGFPRLAEQIIRYIEKKNTEQKIYMTPGPLCIDGVNYENGANALKECFLNPPPFSTGLIQLMAPAGQGKSVMLDMVSYDLAKNYTGASPLLINVDLLGRYVGSIEDAIAGALNNVYYFPMSQSELVFAIKNGWIVLALDGFDELVSRVGAKDAFLKLTGLIDQLDGCGYLLLSARETFFESCEIKFSSQAYLKPKVGAFEKRDSFLQKWNRSERLSLIQKYIQKNKYSFNSNEVYSNIESVFDKDDALLSSPFFLTKIIEWYLEELQSIEEIKSEENSFARIKRIIEKYVEREATKKWLDRDQNPISTIEDHRSVLGIVAEEMYRSSTQRLSMDELKICVEMALSVSNCDTKKIEMFSDKIAIHSVFSIVDGQYVFSHIQFSNYYLALRLSERIKNNNIADLDTFYSDKELPKDVLTWLKWLLRDSIINVPQMISLANFALENNKGQVFRNNVSKLVVVALNEKDCCNLEIKNLLLMGDDMDNISIENIVISDSEFNQLDLSKTNLQNVKILSSKLFYISFGSIERYKNFNIDEKTDINGISFAGGEEIYSPRLINEKLIDCGFLKIQKKLYDNEKNIPENIKEVVSKMISKSNKHYYFSREEMEEEAGNIVYDVIKVGLSRGIFSEKDTPAKKLIKINIDKQMLIEGAERKIPNQAINDFWEELKGIVK